MRSFTKIMLALSLTAFLGACGGGNKGEATTPEANPCAANPCANPCEAEETSDDSMGDANPCAAADDDMGDDDDDGAVEDDM